MLNVPPSWDKIYNLKTHKKNKKKELLRLINIKKED